MAYKENEITLAADIPEDVFKDFEKQRSDRGQIKKQALTAAINLWSALPEEIQARLINKTLSSNEFFVYLANKHKQRACSWWAGIV